MRSSRPSAWQIASGLREVRIGREGVDAPLWTRVYVPGTEVWLGGPSVTPPSM
jgi:hypothetical protein